MDQGQLGVYVIYMLNVSHLRVQPIESVLELINLSALVVQPLVHHSGVLALVSLVVHGLVECSQRGLVEDGPRADHFGQAASHLQDVLAQLDPESTFVAPARGRVGVDARHGVALAGDPALAAGDVDDVGEHLEVEVHLGADVEGLAGGQGRDGRQVVVDDLEGRAGADVAAVEDAVLLAHVLEVALGVLEGGIAARADHEGERAGLGAHGPAGHGGVDKVQRRAGAELGDGVLCGLADLENRRRLDRAAFHDQFLLRVGFGHFDRGGDDARRRVEVDLFNGPRGR